MSVVNPFEGPYGPATDAINAVLTAQVKDVFGYRTFSQSDLLFPGDEKAHIRQLDVRAGAGATPLGYASGKAGRAGLVGIIAPSYSLPYFHRALAQAGDSRVVLNVGALGYDSESGAVTNDYVTALDSAAKLGYGVVTPVSTKEVAATTLLTVAVSKFAKARGAVHLFDGLNYSRAIGVVPALDFDKQADIIKKLEKLLPSIDSNSFEDVLGKFNEVSGLKIHNFQTQNVEAAEVIYVTHGSLESELFIDAVKNSSQSNVGVIAVRVPLPFNVEKFTAVIPKTAKKIVVIGQSLTGDSSSLLKSRVSAALFYSNRRDIQVSEYLYKPDFVWSPAAIKQIIETFSPVDTISIGEDSKGTSKSFIYWASDKSINIDLASKLALSFSFTSGSHISFRSKYDNINNAGTYQAQLVNSDHETAILSNIDAADVSIVEDSALLNHFNITATIKKGGVLVVATSKSTKDVDLSQVESYTENLKFPVHFLNAVAERNINLYVVDKTAIESERFIGYIIQALVWNLTTKRGLEQHIQDVWNSASAEDKTTAPEFADQILKGVESSVKVISTDLYPDFAKLEEPVEEKAETDEEEEEEIRELPIFPIETSFNVSQSSQKLYPEAEVNSKSSIAKALAFKEAYETTEELRPDLPVKNFVVKVKENRRVTPEDYDRYIFHIEFDISGTGLKYDIGEALGIHARNNEEQVREFLKSYGLDETDIVFVPNKDNNGKLEASSVLHAFIDKLDIFGKPPKRFYEALVEYATDEEEKKKLQKLVTPAGAVELKKYQDVEYYTYADIFELYPSARPPLEELVTIISPLKRREYSIASSQKVHPNEVHLLIVVVDWIDNKGRKRFGQASKYISELSVGSELVVSVKPSVMKLPPSPKQPVIMSGLGTGLAPFKAIVEEKLWQKEQGEEIGEVYLFLGSRHKREEYLYGELWEAYKDAGIITHIGAAFSRDQPQKIYIQDRIRESLPALKSAMVDKEGAFYLCGPTWPVPDITQALQDIYAADAAEKGLKVNLGDIIEELKESSRYILEVY